MVDLEDPQARARVRVAQRERVEARAEHHGLAHAPRDRGGERVLRDPAACRDEEAQGPPARVRPGRRGDGRGVLAEDRRRERVGEDRAALEDLVGDTVRRRPAGRQAGLRRSHAALRAYVSGAQDEHDGDHDGRDGGDQQHPGEGGVLGAPGRLHAPAAQRT